MRHIIFSGGPKWGVLGGGQKVYIEKVYVLFRSPMVFWFWMLMLPRFLASSRSIRLRPWTSICCMALGENYSICCPQLSCHLCKTGMHNTSFCNTRGHTPTLSWEFAGHFVYVFFCPSRHTAPKTHKQWYWHPHQFQEQTPILRGFLLSQDLDWGSPKANHIKASQLHIPHFLRFRVRIFRVFTLWSLLRPLFTSRTVLRDCFSEFLSEVRGTFRIFRIFAVSGSNRWFRRSDRPALL